MRLFEIDETHNVRPNKEWIALIPEFAHLLKRDKGSPGDAEGRKKLRARRELAYIFFFCDFASPIRDWLPEEKQKEALYYVGMNEEDLKDEGLQAAIAKYEELQMKNARSLRTYNAMKKGLDNLDKHLEAIDFTAVDKKGEMLNDPLKHAQLMERMTGLYTKLRDFERFVEDDLKKTEATIQGNRQLGDQEAKRNPAVKPWSEEDIRRGSAHAAGLDPEAEMIPHDNKTPTFMDLQKTIHAPRRTNFSDAELAEMEDDTDDKP
jgi:hypothetical protein